MPTYTIYEKSTGKVLRVVQIGIHDDPDKQLRGPHEARIMGGAKKFDYVHNGKIKEEPGARAAHAQSQIARNEAAQQSREARDAETAMLKGQLNTIKVNGTTNEKTMARAILELLNRTP